MSILDDLVPVPLTSFTPETLTTLRSDGKQEGLYFEFKEEWTGPKVTRAICCFANAYGGFLIVGATQHPDGTIGKYPGLDPSVEWPLRVKDQVVGHISSLPVWDAVAIPSPDHPARKVLVVRVESSDQTPHVLTSTGQIYQRTGSACEPVRDKATIDQLGARGASGKARLLSRVQELLLTPESRKPKPEGWRIEIASIPSPPVGLAYRSILTQAGYKSSGDVFPPIGGGRPYAARPLEDGVVLRSGTADLARFTDGSVYARFAAPPDFAYVVTSWVSGLLHDVLEGQAQFSPPVRQVFVWIRLRGIGKRPVAKAPAQFRSDGVFTSDDWGPTTHIVPTAGHESHQIAEQIERRLWRSVGEEVFEEPEQLASPGI